MKPVTALKVLLTTPCVFMSEYVSRTIYECPEIRFIPVKISSFQIIKEMASSCVFPFFFFFSSPPQKKIAEIWHVRNVQGGRLTEGVEVG